MEAWFKWEVRQNKCSGYFLRCFPGCGFYQKVLSSQASMAVRTDGNFLSWKLPSPIKQQCPVLCSSSAAELTENKTPTKSTAAKTHPGISTLSVALSDMANNQVLLQLKNWTAFCGKSRQVGLAEGPVKWSHVVNVNVSKVWKDMIC